ncbi:MAG: hypothetical protein KJ066_19290, partial [Acidobacteria bacterium]|nr:hypothetical protein [Acidobacteriota bacterium]
MTAGRRHGFVRRGRESSVVDDDCRRAARPGRARPVGTNRGSQEIMARPVRLAMVIVVALVCA